MKRQGFDAVQMTRKIVTWWVKYEPEGGIEGPAAFLVILPEKWKKMVRSLPLQGKWLREILKETCKIEHMSKKKNTESEK